MSLGRCGGKGSAGRVFLKHPQQRVATMAGSKK